MAALGHNISPKIPLKVYLHQYDSQKYFLFFWLILLLYLPSCLLTPKKSFLHFICLCSLLNSCKSFSSQGAVYSYRFCKPELNVCFSKSILPPLSRFLFSYMGFYRVLDRRKKIKTRISCVIWGLKQVKLVGMSAAKEYSSRLSFQ